MKITMHSKLLKLYFRKRKSPHVIGCALICRHFYSQYGLAEDTLRTGGSGNAKDISPDELYGQSAIYIAAAHALKPSYSVPNSLSTLNLYL